MPLETMGVGDRGRWLGGVDKVTAVMGSCVGLCKPGLQVLNQKPKMGPLFHLDTWVKRTSPKLACNLSQ